MEKTVRTETEVEAYTGLKNAKLSGIEALHARDVPVRYGMQSMSSCARNEAFEGETIVLLVRGIANADAGAHFFELSCGRYCFFFPCSLRKSVKSHRNL